MNLKALTVALLCLSTLFFQCKKTALQEPVLRLKIKFDPLQDRQGSDGKIVADIPSGHAAQTPAVNSIGCSYIELTPDANTILGRGIVLFDIKDTAIGTNGVRAIDYQYMKNYKDGDILLEIPLKSLGTGKFTYLRLGVAYINFDVKFNLLSVPFAGDFLDERGTFNGFLNAHTFLSSYKIFNKEEKINGLRQQGYWAFETKLSTGYAAYDAVYNGQLFDGSTLTVVNPIQSSSPIPNNSCVVTGLFDLPLTITGTESTDMVATLSLSTNKCFEWEENLRANGKWDITAQANSGTPVLERIVDFGLRGMKITMSAK